MSKIIYVCFKDPSRCNSEIERKIEIIAQRITPDNITPRPPKIVLDGGIAYGIVNPAASIKEDGKSVLLGMAFGEYEKWFEPGQPCPDGSFSIFRSNEQQTEILTDVAASRSVWYYHDEEIFIASSSQRAIVMMLGNFVFNKEVIPWMLSTGSLGPNLSWDSRINFLSPDSSVVLDHKSWETKLSCNVIDFAPEDLSDAEHENRLLTVLTNTFKSLNVDFSKWILPLSGGYDSRGILSLFNFIGTGLKNLRSITWGLKSVINQSGNDAYVARKLAEHYKINHKYYLTDLSEEPLESIFNRFLVCGEGRIDHISGYMDGFEIWKTLHNENIEGIIRGDEGFGWVSVDSSSDVRSRIGISLCSDFSNLKKCEELGINENNLPKQLQKKINETLETWRDRLYHQFRIPVVLAALSDLKFPFVEVINPLLSRKIVYQIRSMPDNLRSNKLLFKKIVASMSPNIGYATNGANASIGYILKSKSAIDLFKLELNTENCKTFISDKLISYTLENLIATHGYESKRQNLIRILKRHLPGWIIKKASSLRSVKSVDINFLAFRIFIICKMKRQLEEDAKVNTYKYNKTGIL